MTEAEWQACKSSYDMLRISEMNKQSARKKRLFACACCRPALRTYPEPAIRRLVDVAEQFADGQIHKQELIAAWNSARPLVARANKKQAEIAAAVTALVPEALAVGAKSFSDACAVAWLAGLACREKLPLQPGLLRHIVGNPFRPFIAPAFWSSSVAALAAALYDGEDCHYALADALMEAGHVELAEHFQESGHPKGCWAMDAILGKQ